MQALKSKIWKEIEMRNAYAIEHPDEELDYSDVKELLHLAEAYQLIDEVCTMKESEVAGLLNGQKIY